jgi:hypothetical protein
MDSMLQGNLNRSGIGIESESEAIKRKKKKEFSILKWIVFPLNSLVLAGVIAYFNLTVFGMRDGAFSDGW